MAELLFGSADEDGHKTLELGAIRDVLRRKYSFDPCGIWIKDAQNVEREIVEDLKFGAVRVIARTQAVGQAPASGMGGYGYPALQNAMLPWMAGQMPGMAMPGMGMGQMPWMGQMPGVAQFAGVGQAGQTPGASAVKMKAAPMGASMDDGEEKDAGSFVSVNICVSSVNVSVSVFFSRFQNTSRISILLGSILGVNDGMSNLAWGSRKALGCATRRSSAGPWSTKICTRICDGMKHGARTGSVARGGLLATRCWP